MIDPLALLRFVKGPLRAYVAFGTIVGAVILAYTLGYFIGRNRWNDWQDSQIATVVGSCIVGGVTILGLLFAGVFERAAHG